MSIRRARPCLIVSCLLLSLAVGVAPASGAELVPVQTPVISVQDGVSFLGGQLYGPAQMSDDARYITYPAGPEPRDLRWLDTVSGTDVAVVTAGFAGPASMSGDGQFVVYVDYWLSAVRLWHAADRSTTTLSEPGPATFDPIAPSISTDGQLIAWNEKRDNTDTVVVLNTSTGVVTEFPGTNGRLSSDGSRLLYRGPDISGFLLVELDSFAFRSAEVGFGAMSDDGQIIGAPGPFDEPRTIVFANSALGTQVSVDVAADGQLRTPVPVISGDGSTAFFTTTASLVVEDRSPDSRDVYRVDTASGDVRLVDLDGFDVVVDVTTDGSLALLWTLTDNGYNLSLLDFNPDAEPSTPPSVPVSALSEPQLSDQVSRLYQAFFLRSPDEDGLRFWVRQRATGRSLVSIAEQFSSSYEFQELYGHLADEEFVNLIYRNVQGRNADPPGLEFWTERLDVGETRGSVMAAFSESTEFIARTATSTPASPDAASVWRLYRAYFLRSADQAGFDYWLGQVSSGRSLASVSEAFAAAPEFQSRYGSLTDAQFVDRVYRNVLGRAPDEVGSAYWTDQLGAGLSRGTLMANFSESPEFIISTDTLPPTKP